MSDPAEMDKLMTEKEYEDYLKSIEWVIYMKVVLHLKLFIHKSFRLMLVYSLICDLISAVLKFKC